MVSKYVLFVCGHNAGRSQMAQAWFTHILRIETELFPSVSRQYEALSAGTRPGERINYLVVQAMGEKGVSLEDTARYYPKHLEGEEIQPYGPDITHMIIACDDRCDIPEGWGEVTQERWELPDPYESPIETVRHVRDLTEGRVRDLLSRLEGELTRN